jgi:purine nucleosidase
VGEPVTRIILDTDLGMGRPGSNVDDGFALALAIADPDITVELVSTVNGNADVDTATRLTEQLLDRLGRSDVPVARGAATPLRGSWSRGVPGTAAHRPRRAVHRPLEHAAAEIVERVMAEPGELTLVAIGPLTNVALALALEPRVATAVRQIVVTGGVYVEHTNVAGRPGEFNFWVDPVSADEVLTSGAPVRLMGLDVTRRVRLSRKDAADLAESGGSFARFAAQCADEWIAHLERTFPGDESGHGSCALRDPLAVAAVTQPELIEWRSAYVRVECDSPRTRGVAIADLLTTRDAPAANCEIAVDVDPDAFHQHFVGRMAELP